MICKNEAQRETAVERWLERASGIKVFYSRLKQIGAVEVSTSEVKVRLKWIFRQPQIKSTYSADLYKLLSVMEKEGEAWRNSLLKLFKSFFFFSLTVQINSREAKWKEDQILFRFLQQIAPTPPNNTSKFATCLCLNLGCCKCVSGRECVIWSSLFLFSFFFFYPGNMQLNLMEQARLNRLKWLSFALTK